MDTEGAQVKTTRTDAIKSVTAGVAGKLGELTGASLTREVRDFAEVHGEVLLGVHSDIGILKDEFDSYARDTSQRLCDIEATLLDLAGVQSRLSNLQKRAGRLEASATGDARSSVVPLALSVVSIVMCMGVVAWILIFVR